MAFCERFGLPRPKVNVRIGGYVVDALFESERLIVELDGYQYHGDRESFEDDRDRDANNLVAGFGTVRIPWDRMTQTPRREAERLLAILEERRSSLSATRGSRRASLSRPRPGTLRPRP